MIAPGAAIGIIGGGQLGRMLCVAAAQLGYRTHVYAPGNSGPAFDVCSRWFSGAYDDDAALAAFAQTVDVVTYEFENIAVAPLRRLAQIVPMHPDVDALAIAQDRLLEKQFVIDRGGRTAPFAPVRHADECASAAAAIGAPGILKTTRFGYDGRGQVRLAPGGDVAAALVAAWDSLGRVDCIYEGMVAFDHEYSVIVARNADDAVVTWEAPDNVHRDGILRRSSLPAPAAILAQASDARDMAIAVARGLDYVGVMTCEFFAGADGPVFNEMAPRVHNSGHWTIEGARTSQFENHIRAICGLPLGATDRLFPRVVMDNLIGSDAADWHARLSDPDCHLHLYGKREALAGRKMGHATYTYPA